MTKLTTPQGAATFQGLTGPSITTGIYLETNSDESFSADIDDDSFRLLTMARLVLGLVRLADGTVRITLKTGG